MSLAIKYETLEDANMRLVKSVVLYRGDPVYVTVVKDGEAKDGIFRVMIKELPLVEKDEEVAGFLKPFGARIKIMDKAAPDEKRKYISSKHFDIAPFKLGYCNSKGGALYCSRMPYRVQKQGLGADNFYGWSPLTKGDVAWATFLRADGLSDMVHGRYPSFDEALALLAKKASAVAFHRDFCLVKDADIPKLSYLYYRQTKVGMFVGDEINLSDNYRCVRECLEETRPNKRIGVV